MTEQPSAVTVARQSLSTLQACRAKLVREREMITRRIADIDATVAKARRLIAEHVAKAQPGRTAA